MNWENYFIKSGSVFEPFWEYYFRESERNVLFIMGMGFDPRTNFGLRSVYKSKSTGLTSTVVLRYYNQKEDVGEQVDPNVQKHILELNSFLESLSLPKFEEKNIILRSDDNKSIASICTTQAFNESDFELYSDVIVDISAMPRGVFLPLINKLMTVISDWNSKCDPKNLKNLHVIVSENAYLDSKIHDRGEAEDGIFIHSLGINDTAKTKSSKEIWIVLIGEGQTKQYEIIKKGIDPAEICPVLPFPSRDLKRADKLIIEYQDLIFNDESFDPKNIIYACEDNPFQVYRLMRHAMLRYDKSFSILNGCKIIVSALSSKLLTVGAFLAVYEAKLNGQNSGIKQVESLGYELEECVNADLDEILKNNNLVELWLAGCPYEK